MPRPVEVGGEVLLRNAHAHTVAKALTKWAGRGLHSLGEAILRMARGLAPKLSELFDLVQRQVIARQVQKAVQQHRAVTGRENQTVAIGPVRVSRVVPE